MSAFAAIFRRDRGPVSERRLTRLADALEHRGADGRDRLLDGAIGLEHLHHWVTPEEVGERQPLRAGDRVVVFDGRIDNRGELLKALDRDSSDELLSDAELVLAAHRAWGDAFCRRLVGPFALVIADLRARRLLLARDSLGDRSLAYAEAGSELLIASEQGALISHPALSAALDESRLAHFFALSVPGDGSTFFRGVTEVHPGTMIVIDEGRTRTESFWSPPAIGTSTGVSSSELAERYLELLALAVSSRMRCIGPVAVMMSGGLDSTSLATLAAEGAAATGAPMPRSISWVFDSLIECDERAYIRPVREHCRIEGSEIVADRLGPTPDGRGLCLDPSGPEENAYRRLKSRAYAEAVAGGSTAVLNGGSADAFYTGYQGWFAALLGSGSGLTALAELAREVGSLGPRTALGRAGFGRFSRRLRRSPSGPRWLTPWARGLLGDRPPADPRAAAAAGPREARGISLEVSSSARQGVDLRHPYRDRRLVEFMLSLPASELYRRGRLKVIARRALEGHLPAEVLARTEATSLTPLFDRAVRGEQVAAWRRLLSDKEALWPRFVSATWIGKALEGSSGPAADVVLWNCLALELWRRRFDR